MCGIVGYVGRRNVTEFLLEGLRRLEYRGYDSAGIAVCQAGAIQIRKRAGRVTELAALVEAQPVQGNVGVGHTRWATHGETTDINSHPHVGGNGNVVLVHNGVIENYTSLRTQLQAIGYVFRTNAMHAYVYRIELVLRIYQGAQCADDLAATVSARPDRLILAYPVISAVLPQGTKSKTFLRLLGPDPAEKLRIAVSAELHVSADTPPTFLFHAADDDLVPVEHSLAFARACWAAGVPAELHVYPRGGHGRLFAYAAEVSPRWREALLQWLADLAR